MSVSSDVLHVYGVISFPEAPEESKECPVYHSPFISNQVIKEHVKCHDKSSGFRFYGCEKDLVDLSDLKAHMLTHVDSADKCHWSTCCKQYSSWKALVFYNISQNSHLLQVGEQSFPDLDCTKVFISPEKQAGQCG